MADAKTKPGSASVADHLAAIEDPARRADCRAIGELMRKATGEAPVLWGTAIVGYGRYHYKYASGREGESALVGWSSRKGDISVYLSAAGPQQAALLARLGRHKMGKACLSIRRLAEVDLAVLEALIVDSVTEMRRRTA